MNGTVVRIEVHRAQASVVKATSSIVCTFSFQFPFSPLSTLLCLRATSVLRNLMGFRDIVRRSDGTYVNNQYAGNLDSSVSQYSITTASGLLR